MGKKEARKRLEAAILMLALANEAQAETVKEIEETDRMRAKIAGDRSDALIEYHAAQQAFFEAVVDCARD